MNGKPVLNSSGLLLLFVFCVSWFISSTALADFTDFASRDDFDAAFPDALVEGWDGFPDGTVFVNGTSAGDITYFSSNGDALVTDGFGETTPPNGLGQTTDGFFLGSDTMTFSFDTSIIAFGIDINTFAVATGDYLATTDTGEVVGSYFDPFPGAATGQFVGFTTDAPFTSVTISAPIDLAYTLDTLRYSPSLIPEPSSAVMVVAVLGAACIRRR